MWTDQNLERLLSPPERLCRALSCLTSPSVRLAALRLSKDWASRLTASEKPFIEFTDACQKIVNSRRFTSILRNLLRLGNHINDVS